MRPIPAQQLERLLRARLRRFARPRVGSEAGGDVSDLGWLPLESGEGQEGSGKKIDPTSLGGISRRLAQLDGSPLLPPLHLLRGAAWCLGALGKLGTRFPISQGQEPSELVALTASLAAAAWMRLGRFEEARFFLTAAWRTVARDSRSRSIRCSILRRRARLLGAMGRLNDAKRLLMRLIRIHQKVGERRAYFLGLSSLSDVLLRGGKAAKSLVAAALATRQLDPKRDRPSFHRATLQLAWCCFEAGHLDLAREGLRCTRVFGLEADQRSVALENRADWLAARIAERDGEPELALAGFRDAAGAYLQEGSGLSFCQVTLEHVMLLFRLGRTAEIPALLTPMLTLLRQHHCPAHRIAAVILIRKAVLAGRLTEDLIRSALSSLTWAAPLRRS